jgi:hypothetical protein
MEAALILSLRLFWVTFLLFCLVEGANVTEAVTDSIPKYTGWNNGPGARSTADILWSCLTTVISCTWTILHLNIPGAKDGTWTKFWRKLKWMGITLIFPEFTFAKAVCELQMAVEDLHELSLRQDVFDWEVEYGWGCRLLHKLLRPQRPSSSRISITTDAKSSIPTAEEQPETPCVEQRETQPAGSWDVVYKGGAKKWTLTHCYLANMGGLVVAPISTYAGSAYPSTYPLESFTAHCLVQCCLPTGCNPLSGDIRLSKEEIVDKCKADCLMKAVATLQILWLIVSVITRTCRGLPLSQLEICTVAFAAMAIVTYVTNWAKPKDVEIPFAIVNEDPQHSGSCKAFTMRGQSCITRAAKPSQLGQNGTSRILNDSFRLQLHGTFFLTLSYALAFSTVGFGAIHCAAWPTDFPTHVEKLLWMVASVLATILPLSNMVLMGVTIKVLQRETRKLLRCIQRDSERTRHCSFTQSPTYDMVFWKDDGLWSSRNGTLDVSWLHKRGVQSNRHR